VTLSVAIGLSTRSFRLDVAFEVPPGVTVLFGPSGAGKSRTLACIAGLARPDTGRIALGKDAWFDAEKGVHLPIHERHAAYVFQSLALFPHMTALENVMYGIAKDKDGKDREARAREQLGRMHVEHLADRRPRTFSGGEGQRVALARAFATTPRVLLLDEPFSALDAPVKKKLLAEVREWLGRERIPTILVTHDAGEARDLGERVIFVEDGKVVAQSGIDDARLSLSRLEAAPAVADPEAADPSGARHERD
jgi:molybdate transport system ATP-binding protein